MIRLDGVVKTYRTRKGDLVHALAETSLTVGENEFVTLVGPSGCGKSTLLKLVAGLVPVTQGEIRVREQIVREPFPDVGFVFQQPVLLPWRSVLDNVLFSVEMLGLDLRQYRKPAGDLLELTGLAGFETKYPHELSGGMQQRVAICRALLPDPGLLLMDEPFGALDAMTRDILHDELERIWSERELTVLFVTHNVREAARLSDRTVLLTSRPGRVADEFVVDIDRPRRIDSPPVSGLAAKITDRLRKEVARHGH